MSFFMLPILQNNSVLTMTSLEIADLVGSRHDKVKQSIERLADDNEHRKAIIQLPPLGEVKNHLGQSISVYKVNKRDSLIVVAQLSPEFTAAIVDRWQELEQQVSFVQLPDFSNPVAAARAWADAKESEQKALAQIEASRPALLVYEALANRRMDCNTTTLAKQLGTTATKLNTFLKSAGVKFKHQDLPMATHSDWFNVVTGVAKNGYETIQCLITPLGQIEIAKLWGEK